MEEILNQLLKINHELASIGINNELEGTIADLLDRFFVERMVGPEFTEPQLDSSWLPAYRTTGRLKRVSLGLRTLILYERTGRIPNDACYEISKIKSIKIIEEK